MESNDFKAVIDEFVAVKFGCGDIKLNPDV